MDVAAPIPLRERRRAELRQQLSDTATALFLRDGFDAVTVADVARACGVTEKTVFNHYRTKEALLVDRWPQITATAVALVRDPARTPASGVTQTLDTELDVLTARGTADPDRLVLVRRFGELVAATEALQDHRRRSLHLLVEELRAALTSRGDLPTNEVDLQMTAVALSGLFQVFYRSLGRHLSDPGTDAATCRRKVRADVRRAARLLPRGLGG
ncbi:TetR/AcrR family transcriptional regulator [Jatrophihabitans sp. YIM 134969]